MYFLPQYDWYIISWVISLSDKVWQVQVCARLCVCGGGVLCVHSSVSNPSRRHQSETWKPIWGPFLNKDLKHTPSQTIPKAAGQIASKKSSNLLWLEFKNMALFVCHGLMRDLTIMKFLIFNSYALKPVYLENMSRNKLGSQSKAVLYASFKSEKISEYLSKILNGIKGHSNFVIYKLWKLLLIRNISTILKSWISSSIFYIFYTLESIETWA